MTCCSCNKEIDITNNGFKDGTQVPKWYGLYKKNELLKVICNECITDKIKKEKYIKG